MDEKINGEQLLTTLKRVEDGVRFDIWNLLPDSASGQNWQTEISYTAGRISEYIDKDNDYSLEDLRDLGAEYANAECENTYKAINDEVQALDLWAMPEIEEDVELYGTTTMSLTRLSAIYLFSAKRMTWDAVIDQVFQNIAELEEVSA